jgi:hypothetical protein
MSTVQAPHCAMPQPYFVPVSFNESRRTHSKGVSGSTSTAYALPLIMSEIAMSLPPMFAREQLAPHDRPRVSARVGRMGCRA